MNTLRYYSTCRLRPGRKRAAAIVEFAVVLPLLTVIMFGIIEYGYVFNVRQTLTHAAREGSRIAMLQTTDDPYTEVTDRVADVMEPTGLTSYTVEMIHAAEGNSWTETVAIRIPYMDVSLMGNFFGSRTGNLAATSSMRKEGVGASS